MESKLSDDMDRWACKVFTPSDRVLLWRDRAAQLEAENERLRAALARANSPVSEGEPDDREWEEAK